jgi:hypothetical protein
MAAGCRQGVAEAGLLLNDESRARALDENNLTISFDKPKKLLACAPEIGL